MKKTPCLLIVVFALGSIFVSFPATPATGEVIVAISNARVSPGSTDFTVGLSIKGHSVGIRGAEINVGYDDSNLTFKKGEIVDGEWYQSRFATVTKEQMNTQSGQLKILMAAESTRGISAGAASILARLTFDLGSSAVNQAFPLTFLGSSPGIRDISINKITLSPAGGNVFNTDTIGDVNGSGSVTPSDASAAFSLYLTKEWEDMTDLEQFAADSNESGSISPSDASGIFEKYLNQ